MIVSRRGVGELYNAACPSQKTDPWECLARVVAERNPGRIGIDESDTFNFGDGLTASLKAKLVEAVGPKYASRLSPRLRKRMVELFWQK